MCTVIKLIYLQIIVICLVFSSSSLADKQIDSHESIQAKTNIPSHLTPDSAHKCKLLKGNTVQTQSVNDLSIARGDVYDREPNCCGQCYTASGQRGCNVYINGEWACSGC
jgi:hypothetical protein